LSSPQVNATKGGVPFNRFSLRANQNIELFTELKVQRLLIEESIFNEKMPVIRRVCPKTGGGFWAPGILMCDIIKPQVIILSLDSNLNLGKI